MLPEPVKRSQLVATLSLVSDLGMGQPMERVLRQTVIAMRLADAAGVAPEVKAATYYTSLLTWVGCATDTSELAELFGDETHLYAESHDGDLAGASMAPGCRRPGGPRIHHRWRARLQLLTGTRGVEEPTGHIGV